MQNWESSKRSGSIVLRVRAKIERLERVMAVSKRVEPIVHRINFVDGDGRVAGSMMMSDVPEL